ncbi:MAG: hypothetical protein AMXMBFR83_01390 [Phycisphaerae bacterium]
MNTEQLISAIKGNDEAARAQAWMNAGPVGVEAVAPLTEVMASTDTETRRAATRALWKIVRHAGRPGAEQEAAAVSAKLIAVLEAGPPAGVAREIAWMLSEIAGDEATAPLGRLLKSTELREHARAALQRIPGAKSLGVLEAALTSAPPEYQPAIAVSLRCRGVDVPDVRNDKLKPTRQTTVRKGGK